MADTLKRIGSGHTDLDLAEAIDLARPNTSHIIPDVGDAPSFDTGEAMPTTLSPIGVRTLPTLRAREQRRLPMLSPGVAPGSSADFENQLTRLRSTDTLADHPTRLGKAGHVLGTIGNIAGNIVAPGVMANIPGTEMNRAVQIRQIEPRLAAAKKEESEEGLRNTQEENIQSEIRARDTANKENLVSDAQGNVVGWKDKNGGLRSLSDPETPAGIKDIAETSANKLAQPKFEKDENGNIVKLSTDKAGKTSSEVVYKGDPKLETDLVHGHMVAGVPHTLLVNKKNGKTIKDLGEEKMPSQEAAKEHNIEVVRAYDKDNKPHLMSKEDAEKEGFTHVTKATDKDIDDARTHTATLNDMQAKLNDVVASRKALEQDAAQRAIIARSLRSLDKYTTIGQLADAGILSGASPETQEYIQSVLSLRESAMGLPKELTKGSRVSEIQTSALWATLPSGASLNADYALNQSKKFQANIDRLRERVDEVRGIQSVDRHPELMEQKKGASEAPGIVRDANGNIDWKKTLGITEPEKKP